MVVADPAITCCRRVVGVFYSFLLSFAKTPHHTSHTVTVIIRFSHFSFGRGRKEGRGGGLVGIFTSVLSFIIDITTPSPCPIPPFFFFVDLDTSSTTYPRPPGEKLGHRAVALAAPINQIIFLSPHVCLGCTTNDLCCAVQPGRSSSTRKFPHASTWRFGYGFSSGSISVLVLVFRSRS